MTYGFGVILKVVEFTAADADRLYGAGCDDASILTRDGVTMVQFDREAPTLEEAIRSAIANVECAGFVVSRVEIERDELTLAAS